MKKSQKCLGCGKDYIPPHKRLLDYYLCEDCLKKRKGKPSEEILNRGKRIITVLEDDEYDLLVDILGHSDNGSEGAMTLSSLCNKLLR